MSGRTDGDDPAMRPQYAGAVQRWILEAASQEQPNTPTTRFGTPQVPRLFPGDERSTAHRLAHSPIPCELRGVTTELACYAHCCMGGFPGWFGGALVREVVPAVVGWTWDHKCSAVELLASMPPQVKLNKVSAGGLRGVGGSVRDHVKPPTHFLSYAWSSPTSWLFGTGGALASTTGIPRDAVWWIDFLAVAQHQGGTEGGCLGRITRRMCLFLCIISVDGDPYMPINSGGMYEYNEG